MMHALMDQAVTNVLKEVYEMNRCRT
eukprot:SAG11_NODE_6842_length_1237_cov_2.188049_3_plen_25_part_01